MAIDQDNDDILVEGGKAPDGFIADQVFSYFFHVNLAKAKPRIFFFPSPVICHLSRLHTPIAVFDSCGWRRNGGGTHRIAGFGNDGHCKARGRENHAESRKRSVNRSGGP
jgi:hypothetical protein